MKTYANPVRMGRRLTKAEMEQNQRIEEAYTEEEALSCLLRTSIRTRNPTVAAATADALSIGMVDYRRRFVSPSRPRVSRRK